MAMQGREQRGLEIATAANQVRRIDDTTYTVKSQTGNGEYAVSRADAGWICACPDFTYRGVKCKHIYAVEFSSRLRREAEIRRVEPITDLTNCIFCDSGDIVRDGVRRNKYGDVQKFHCKACGHYFTFNIGFERMKHNPQSITAAMQLYFSGESLRHTQESLKLIGVSVSHQTVYNWIRKYIRLMEEYVVKLKLNVSDTWRADELWVKVKGDMKYVFALMDDETRFWIAQEVADTKHAYDARRLFKKAKEAMGKKPKVLITDGLPAYHEAHLKEFWTSRKATRTEHISHIRIKGDKNNNKMERMNGEVRDREKVMRGLKREDTPILRGYQLFHNYVRPHEALEGRTPAEACGLEVRGENRWMTLIQNAAHQTKVYRQPSQTAT